MSGAGAAASVPPRPRIDFARGCTRFCHSVLCLITLVAPAFSYSGAQVPNPPNIGKPSGGGGSSISVDRPGKTRAAGRRSSGTAASSGGGLATLTEAQLAPLVVQRFPAEYPPFAKNMKITGTVLVTLDLASDGTLMQADAVSGPEMLYGACIDALRKWKFSPLTRNGKTVPVRSELHFAFTDPTKGVSD